MIDKSTATDGNLLQSVLDLLLTPVSWIPGLQRWLLQFFLESPSAWVAVGKMVFLLFPMVLLVAGLWCTQLSLYTIPFRSNRVKFAEMMLLGWWDAIRAAWSYWVGVVRFVVVAAGWCLTMARLGLRLIMETFRQVLVSPFTMTSRLSRNYFQPGVPWIAFVLLLLWCLLEATIFTYTLFPTVSEVLTDLVGVDAPRFTGVILYLFLLFLILGSFACLQALIETFRKREFRFVVQMVVVELFVMFFEVMFLYRELVDAITPWIAQQTGERFRMGIVFTLSLATFGWVGIRGMTWFLFGQFGTPPLLAFISRRALEQAGGPAPAPAGTETASWWRIPVQDFRSDIEWLHAKSEELLEYLTLPFLHVLGAALNFGMIVLASSPVMSLPLKSLKDVMATRDMAAALRMQPKKVGL
jgi:hypothetical protein